MSSSGAVSGPTADPFGERLRGGARLDLSLLGARFEFQSSSPELLRLVRWAFAGLPAHRLSATMPRIRIRLVRCEHDAGTRLTGDPPPMQPHSGVGLLGAVTASASFVALSPVERAALVVVSPELVSSAYHARYELIEFAVFTLAARVQALTPLHAACVGQGGRGLLLIGDSGAGKSTLALHCLLGDFKLVAEDSVFVQPKTLLATGVGNFLHVRDDSLRFLSGRERAMVQKSPVIRRRSGVEKFEVDVRRTRTRLARAPMKLAAVVFATAHNAGAEPALRRLQSRDLLARLEATQPYAAARPEWSAFCKSVARLPAYELARGAHPSQAVPLMRALLAKHGRGAKGCWLAKGGR
ncbi:MAG TPA: hypothetical protein VHB68_03760 [Steroidobacteraceae bacterium]|nr:hypothetical protein [Steroidobacteraceae bacterium]